LKDCIFDVILLRLWQKYIDFRECVVQNVLDGMARGEVIRIFKIGSNSLTRWLRWHREKGDLSTQNRGRYNSKKLSDKELLHTIMTVV
jgi:transposase